MAAREAAPEGERQEASPEPAAPGDDGAEALVAEAIGKLRGHAGKQMPTRGYEALDAGLEEARQVLAANPAAALEAIGPLLSSESKDSFLIIELAGALALIEKDPDGLVPAAAAIERADVGQHPAGTVRALVRMASRSCDGCLPAMFRVLELVNPRTSLPERGLPLLGRETAIMFTLGQYGEAALPRLIASLDSDDCTVRGNSAMALR
jgi:hypothetical protein